jgi:hypothetical protein
MQGRFRPNHLHGIRASRSGIASQIGDRWTQGPDRNAGGGWRVERFFEAVAQVVVRQRFVCCPNHGVQRHQLR